MRRIRYGPNKKFIFRNFNRFVEANGAGMDSAIPLLHRGVCLQPIGLGHAAYSFFLIKLMSPLRSIRATRTCSRLSQLASSRKSSSKSCSLT